jgi:hypothetical protein
VFARHLIFKIIAPRKKDGYFISSLESEMDFTPKKIGRDLTPTYKDPSHS